MMASNCVTNYKSSSPKKKRTLILNAPYILLTFYSFIILTKTPALSEFKGDLPPFNAQAAKNDQQRSDRGFEL